jgi:hypothetical protein
MANNKRHIPALETFLDYIYNRMTPQNRNALEKQLQRDAFAEDAAEGLSIADEDRVRKDISMLQQRITGKKKNRKQPLWIAVAAAIALLIVSSITFLAVEKINKDARERRLGYEAVKAPQETIVYPTPAEPLEKTSSEVIIPAGKPILPKVAVDPLQRPIQEEVMVEAEQIYEDIPVMDFDIEEFMISVKEDRSFQAELSSEIQVHVPVQGDRSMDVVPQLAERKAPGESHYTLKGKIVDSEDGTALPGVTVTIKGTSKGTVTDMHGNFALDIPRDGETILVASFIGMHTEEFTAREFNEVLAMAPDITTLSELIVIGYGTARKSEEYKYTPAEPMGGFINYQKYLNVNATLPENSNIKKAVVVLNFTITNRGEPTDFTVVRSPNEEFTQKAIELIRTGPAWIPAKAGYRNMEEKVRVRIVFR